jgi:adenylate cyclase
MVLVRLHDPTFIQSVRLRFFDQLISSQPENPINIYAVDIDERAVDAHGQWPFHRGVYADTIKDLYVRGAGLVVLNIMMSESDRQGGDQELAKTLAEYPVVLVNVPAETTKNTPRTPGSAVINSEHMHRILNYPGIIANITDLESVAAGIGSAHTLPEIDGVNRRLPLVMVVDNKMYPSLAMEILRVAAGDSTFQVKMNETGIDKMRIKAFGPIQTDNFGRIWIDWSQRPISVSLSNIPDQLDGAVVIIGPTAAGISNPVPTSIGAQHPHYVQAVVAGTLMNRVVISRPQWIEDYEVVALVILGVIIVFLTRWTYYGIIGSFVILSSCIFGSMYSYSNYHYLVDGITVTAGLVGVLLHAYMVKFITELNNKLQIKRQFRSYLSPAMVDKLQQQPELLQLGGEERELTIAFTDVRGFTTISEHYGKDVQGLTKLMNRYMSAMTEKILENNGTLDKYIGDAQMFFYNAPVADFQHASHAVKTALEMQESLSKFNEEITAEGIPAFGMGIGINTDNVVVGNMGSEQRFDYTCLGDGVNLASRLEGQSKPYGVKIILGPKTAEYVKDEYFILELDKVQVKGKSEGVNIFTVLGRLDQIPAHWFNGKEEHESMIALYRKRKFETCVYLCYALMEEFDGQMDGYYEAWIARCHEQKQDAKKLPADWDGTYITNTK